MLHLLIITTALAASPSGSVPSGFVLDIKTHDRHLESVLDRAKLYEMSKAYQDGQSVKLVGADPNCANVNPTFARTFGLSESDLNSSAHTFMYLPQAVKVFNDHWPIKWVFPTGTVFGEVLTMRGVPWEIRLREKVGDHWEPKVYRTFSKSDVEHLLIAQREVYDGDRHGMLDVMQSLSDDEVARWLRKPFKDVTDDNWSGVGGLFPNDYKLGLVSIDRTSCAECHRDGLKFQNSLTPNEKLTSQARIRGCDGILSWHPFNESLAGIRGDDDIELMKLRDFRPDETYQFAVAE